MVFCGSFSSATMFGASFWPGAICTTSAVPSPGESWTTQSRSRCGIEAQRLGVDGDGETAIIVEIGQVALVEANGHWVSSLGKCVEDARPGALALGKEVSSYFSFGEWMRSSVEAEADEQRIHAEHALEIADDRDRPAHARSARRACPILRVSAVLRLDQERRIVGELDRGRTAMRMELDRAIGRDALFDELAEIGADLGRVLRRRRGGTRPWPTPRPRSRS